MVAASYFNILFVSYYHLLVILHLTGCDQLLFLQLCLLFLFLLLLLLSFFIWNFVLHSHFHLPVDNLFQLLLEIETSYF